MPRLASQSDAVSHANGVHALEHCLLCRRDLVHSSQQRKGASMSRRNRDPMGPCLQWGECGTSC